KMYIAKLKAAPPAAFRKGVGLDRPTCLAGLEVMSKDHPENYLRINDAKFESYLVKLRREANPNRARSLCTKAIRQLMDQHLFIPMGEMHFSMMVKPQFVGWEVNETNQLDLTDLRLVKNDKKQ